MNTMLCRHKKNGFSLVELSIVLVILGLLTGGILAGQALIRASELRSVATDASRYQAAIFAFRDKYFALPGDMNNATAFWGKDNTRCPGDTGTTTVPGTCNGNNDGNIGAFIEGYRIWQHLANAGLIEGNYNGYVTPATSATVPIRGTEVPASKIGNAYWTVAYLSQLRTTNHELGFSDLPDIRNTYMILSGSQSGWWASSTSNAALRPEEAWNLDTKMDDGLIAQGKVRGGSSSICTAGAASTNNYQLTNTSFVCLLGFILN